ncbi:MAG: hypothetical protein SGI97_01195 [candidate division Zixibacteria bacterium]|nr:hypothetical protein [candidate division Zixibacteria bacterium]
MLRSIAAVIAGYFVMVALTGLFFSFCQLFSPMLSLSRMHFHE